jgi:hypothetical protein
MAAMKKKKPLFKILSVCRGGGYHYCRTDPPHPRRNSSGLYPLHRVKAENRLGRLLRKGEIVHHKNEIKDDDKLRNLHVTTNAEHARFHALERRKMPILVQCPECNKSLELRPHIYRLRIKRNKSKVICCSPKCSWARQFRAA